MFEGDIYDGMKLMAPGDSFTFAVVADSFFYKTANMKKLPDFVTAGEPMYFDIKMEKVLTAEQYKQRKKQELLQKQLKQEQTLNKYLKENNITEKPLASGLYYKTLQKGYGRKPKAGEMCQVYLHVEAVGVDYVLFDNYKDDPIFIEYGKPFDTEGLMEGLGMMKEGEKARLIVPSKIGVGADGNNGAVPAFSTIIYEVKLDKLKTKEEVEKIRKKIANRKKREKEALKQAEPGKIAAYVKKHNITTKPLASGLYYLPEKEGKGAHPQEGNTLSVHYTLYNTDDEKLFSTYDDGRPFMFVLGSGAVIQGWEEALPLMRKGGKAKLIIPSKLGYKGVEKKAFNIPPYSPLIIELEVMDIRK
jgi:FKBP-type peptidyl-prolyl cis-trans isomerase